MHKNSSAEAVVAFWTLRKLNQSEYPSFDLGHRKKAVVYFTTEEHAINFLKADVIATNWRIFGMSADAFVGWLTQRMKSRTYFIFRNPSNRFCFGKSVRILELLTELQKEHSENVASRQ